MGFASSMDLAEKAGIKAGTSGVDLCCCSGAGIACSSASAAWPACAASTPPETVVKLGQQRSQAAGLADRITFILANVCRTGLPDAIADFVWGEDAWCYVVDKKRLIAEAARIVKPGGTIAFTDWIEGPEGLTDSETRRFLTFMKFPSIQDPAGYCQLLVDSGCDVLRHWRHGPLRPRRPVHEHVEQSAHLRRVRIVGYDATLLGQLAAEMKFIGELAHAGKITRPVRAQTWPAAGGACMIGNGCNAPRGGDAPAAGSPPAHCGCSGGGRDVAGDPAAWFGRMIDHCLQYAQGSQGGGPPDRRHPLRVHTPRVDPRGRGGSRVPLRRFGGHHPRGGKALARQSLPLDQIDLWLPPRREQSVPGNGRPNSGRDDLRRQEENV